MIIGFIGDVHGDWKIYTSLVQTARDAGAEATIQVGDYGVGFGRVAADESRWGNNESVFTDSQFVQRFGPYTGEALSGSGAFMDHRFIRGNHDNPNACRKNKLWIPDGTEWNGVYCVGGASSIDRQFRTEGIDWWPDEELSYDELQRIIDDYVEKKPRIVVSHDCPESIARASYPFYTNISDGGRTRQALQAMFDAHQPDVWLYGHWHVPNKLRRMQTLFLGLDIYQLVLYNTETRDLFSAIER